MRIQNGSHQDTSAPAPYSCFDQVPRNIVGNHRFGKRSEVRKPFLSDHRLRMTRPIEAMRSTMRIKGVRLKWCLRTISVETTSQTRLHQVKVVILHTL